MHKFITQRYSYSLTETATLLFSCPLRTNDYRLKRILNAHHQSMYACTRAVHMWVVLILMHIAQTSTINIIIIIVNDWLNRSCFLCYSHWQWDDNNCDNNSNYFWFVGCECKWLSLHFNFASFTKHSGKLNINKLNDISIRTKTVHVL